ncbi:MAG: orotate phosphoribosyltransferase [Geminicoccaceae bacterium]|nr:orotate phosphoribosyltransferase [Geminicoccaceae bacterium]
MTQEAVLDEFRAAGALLEGHFILSSGKRSPRYLQCARVMMDPRRGERLATALAETCRGLAVDAVVAPAMGGLVVGHELARALGVLSLFVERIEGRFALRRGFSIGKGWRVLIAEDVVTTGLSTREAAACCAAEGAEVVGVACLVDRTGGKAGLGFPLIALAAVDVPVYEPDGLPPDLAAIPAVKPGSRGL